MSIDIEVSARLAVVCDDKLSIAKTKRTGHDVPYCDCGSNCTVRGRENVLRLTCTSLARLASNRIGTLYSIKSQQGPMLVFLLALQCQVT